jgi:hypothetical protein
MMCAYERSRSRLREVEASLPDLLEQTIRRTLDLAEANIGQDRELKLTTDDVNRLRDEALAALKWRCQSCGAPHPEGTPLKRCEKCGGPLRRLLVQEPPELPPAA